MPLGNRYQEMFATIVRWAHNQVFLKSGLILLENTIPFMKI